MGTHYARFTQFVRPPLVVADYLRDVATGREARYLGHNPAGGAMILALLVTLAGLCISGWLLTTDA
ncbi:MAG: cytochrome b/b6 domain-containing protein, partial [Methyloceanibacter sp.]